MRIAAVATGVGNISSVLRAVRCTASRASEVVSTADPDILRKADVVVVPGQGSFGAFAHALDRGLREVLREQIGAGKPFLGICLGLQILFEESDEAPGERGLGVLAGRVRRLDVGGLPLPHMGWNLVEPRVTSQNDHAGLFARPAHFYFAHSYAAVPSDPSVTLATTDYGGPVVCAVKKDNVVGVQFHPEKSQREGLSLLTRFFARI